jgi:hypothetical protein
MSIMSVSSDVPLISHQDAYAQYHVYAVMACWSIFIILDMNPIREWVWLISWGSRAVRRRSILCTHRRIRCMMDMVNDE